MTLVTRAPPVSKMMQQTKQGQGATMTCNDQRLFLPERLELVLRAQAWRRSSRAGQPEWKRSKEKGVLSTQMKVLPLTGKSGSIHLHNEVYLPFWLTESWQKRPPDRPRPKHRRFRASGGSTGSSCEIREAQAPGLHFQGFRVTRCC